MNMTACDALPSQPATVLVVEADAVFREFETRALTDRGYDVLMASGTEEALRMVRQSRNISLLLHGSPIHEPDSLELTRHFRTARPGVPVLLLLWSLEGLGQSANNLGRVGVMAKPFQLSELINNVHRLLAEVHPSSVDSHTGATASPAMSPIRGRVIGQAKKPRSRNFNRQNVSKVHTDSCAPYESLILANGADPFEGSSEGRAFPS
jgi:CheY-like chemotaxis protein